MEVKGAVLDGGCGVMLTGFTVSAIFCGALSKTVVNM